VIVRISIVTMVEHFGREAAVAPPSSLVLSMSPAWASRSFLGVVLNPILRTKDRELVDSQESVDADYKFLICIPQSKRTLCTNRNGFTGFAFVERVPERNNEVLIVKAMGEKSISWGCRRGTGTCVPYR
jgi:hypothetical protein